MSNFSIAGQPPRPLHNPDKQKKCNCETCILPSPNNCRNYYLCLNKTAYHMSCSNGLLFDKSKNTCNYAYTVSCDESATTKSTTTKMPTKKPTKPVTKATSPTTSTSTKTIPITKRPVTKATSPTTSTSTKTIPITKRPITIPTTSPKRFKCPQSNGMFRNPFNCHSFMHCSNWWPYVKACPGGLHFSTETERCEYPCDAKCDVTLPCVAKGIGSTAPPVIVRDPICSCADCLLASEESCTKYIECKNGRATVKACRAGQTFDSKRETCDWAHRVDCRHSEMCFRRNGLFAYRGDCHKFVHCSNGIPYVRTCPGGLYFDADKLRCEWSYGKCDSTVITSKPGDADNAVKPTPNPVELKCPQSYGYFRHPSGCNKFYVCVNGVAHLKECPKNLHFNAKTRSCDWPRNVKCDLKDYPQRRCRVYERNIVCHQNRTYLTHPHCDMYYDCSTGRPCAKRCPDGLYFNSNAGTCDEPKNVDCQIRDGELYGLRNFAELCHHKKRGSMTDPANPSCFYRCDHTRVVRGCCSRNRVFDERHSRCSWPHS